MAHNTQRLVGEQGVNTERKFFPNTDVNRELCWAESDTFLIRSFSVFGLLFSIVDIKTDCVRVMNRSNIYVYVLLYTLMEHMFYSTLCFYLCLCSFLANTW